MPVPTIFATVQARPFGIRAGLAPLLLAIVVAAHSHEYRGIRDRHFPSQPEGS